MRKDIIYPTRDPKISAIMQKWLLDSVDRKERNRKRSLRFFSDEKSFSVFLKKLLKKHSKRWESVCYKNGAIPYCWNILNSIVDIATEEGSEIDPIDGLTENFPSCLYMYNGFIFAITHGQGSVLSIYNSNKKLIYRN